MNTTTIMRDSEIGDAWIRQVCAENPPKLVLDASGNPTGNVLSGPVRASFVNLFEKSKSMEEGKEGKYQITILFPPTDISVIRNEYIRMADLRFQENKANGIFHGIHNPLRDAAEKMHFGGYTPGCFGLNATSQFQPPVVDAKMTPLTDPNKVYSGCWVLVSMNAYSFAVPKKKGVSFGLQSVMFLADDTRLAGGAVDPQTQFGGVKVMAPPVNPEAKFGKPGAAALTPCVMCGIQAPVGGVCPSCNTHN